MGKSKRGIWPILFFMGMAVGLNAVSGQTKYFKLGGTLKLEQGSPPPPGSSITWKFQSNKVIEYDPNFTEDIDVYGDFKNRATLNKATGQLETTDLTKKDSGVYTLEVNSEVNATYTVAVIRSVPTPKILLTTEDGVSPCDIRQHTCRLTCEVPDSTDAEPVTYSWEVETGTMEPSSDKYRDINDIDRGKTFTCKIKNPISEEQASYTVNKGINGLGIGLGIASGVGVPLLVLALLSQFIPQLREKRNNFFQSLRSPKTASSPEAPPDNKVTLLNSNKTGEGVEGRNGNSN
ncbi:uncharacterized protein LOC124474721 isoform X2 [Hypomesus transpacificus]|uniref:uncharacterized protein LOC124474721 isoform X2 n=1 Tax=Hypomesus transpacificus TaxID=137520 RepID=UPI001F07E7F9|nr:uncharacterized protein LOC124474721 isoform X2 [Hypomesus transpacificus]